MAADASPFSRVEKNVSAKRQWANGRSVRARLYRGNHGQLFIGKIFLLKAASWSRQFNLIESVSSGGIFPASILWIRSMLVVLEIERLHMASEHGYHFIRLHFARRREGLERRASRWAHLILNANSNSNECQMWSLNEAKQVLFICLFIGKIERYTRELHSCAQRSTYTSKRSRDTRVTKQRYARKNNRLFSGNPSRMEPMTGGVKKRIERTWMNCREAARTSGSEGGVSRGIVNWKHFDDSTACYGEHTANDCVTRSRTIEAVEWKMTIDDEFKRLSETKAEFENISPTTKAPNDNIVSGYTQYKHLHQTHSACVSAIFASKRPIHKSPSYSPARDPANILNSIYFTFF